VKASDLLSKAELVKALERALKIDATYAFLTLEEILLLVDPKLSDKEIAKVIEYMDGHKVPDGLMGLFKAKESVLTKDDDGRSHMYAYSVQESLERHTDGDVYSLIQDAKNHKKIMKQLNAWIREI